MPYEKRIKMKKLFADVMVLLNCYNHKNYCIKKM